MRRLATPVLFGAGFHFLLVSTIPSRAFGDPAELRPPQAAPPAVPAAHSRFVHLVAPPGIELQTDDPNGGFTVVCKSPCDTVLPTDIEYRATGRGVLNSAWFAIPDDVATETIEVRAASETAQWVGVLMVGAGVLTAGFTFLHALAAGGDDGGRCGGPSQPPCPDSGTQYGWLVALGVAGASALSGLIVLIANGGTRIVQTRGPLRPPDVVPGPAASVLDGARRERGLALVPALPSPGVVLFSTVF